MSQNKRSLRVLITAGPTRAYIDEVRYISNYSTGALGVELVQAFKRLPGSCKLEVIAGPTAQDWKRLKPLRFYSVETNQEMYLKVLERCRVFRPHYVFFAAAVLDFEPISKRSGKLSSSVSHLNLALKASPKIIDAVGLKFPNIKRVGFKLEWEAKQSKIRNFAENYLKRKRLDFLCLNFLSEIQQGRHSGYLFSRRGDHKVCKGKKEIATRLATWVCHQWTNLEASPVDS